MTRDQFNKRLAEYRNRFLTVTKDVDPEKYDFYKDVLDHFADQVDNYSEADPADWKSPYDNIKDKKFKQYVRDVTIEGNSEYGWVETVCDLIEQDEIDDYWTEYQS